MLDMAFCQNNLSHFDPHQMYNTMLFLIFAFVTFYWQVFLFSPNRVTDSACLNVNLVFLNKMFFFVN